MKRKTSTLLGAALTLLIQLTSTAAANGPIVFNTYMPGTPSQVCVMNPDGTNLRQLTTGTTSSGGAAWHPSLQYVSFFRDGNLLIMQALQECAKVRPFVVGPASVNGAGFSPDGKRIVYVDSQVGATVIKTVDVAKKKVGPAEIAWIGLAYAPSFSPDGQKIVFSSHVNSPDGGPHIKVLDLATGSIISYDDIDGYVPAYSQDGNWIAFSTGTALYVRSIDGTQLIQITSVPSPASISWNSFSQDGTQLAFGSNVSGEMSIYKVTIVDGAVSLLQRQANAPHWRP